MTRSITAQALDYRNRIKKLDAEIDSLAKTRDRLAQAYAALTGDETTFAAPSPATRWTRSHFVRSPRWWSHRPRPNQETS
jgi:anti-sigma factor RsiW